SCQPLPNCRLRRNRWRPRQRSRFPRSPSHSWVSQLFEIPTNEAVDVVFFISGVRTWHVGPRIHTQLLTFANLPILVGGQFPKWQQLLEVVILSLHRVFADKPDHTRQRRLWSCSQEP